MYVHVRTYVHMHTHTHTHTHIRTHTHTHTHTHTDIIITLFLTQTHEVFKTTKQSLNWGKNMYWSVLHVWPPGTMYRKSHKWKKRNHKRTHQDRTHWIQAFLWPLLLSPKLSLSNHSMLHPKRKRTTTRKKRDLEDIYIYIYIYIYIL